MRRTGRIGRMGRIGGTPDTGYPLPDTGYRIPDTGYPIPDFRLRIAHYALPSLFLALCLTFPPFAPCEPPPLPSNPLEAVQLAEASDLICETMVSVQRDLLLHYASKDVPYRIRHYLGKNYVVTREWDEAEKWFRKAGAADDSSDVWLSAVAYAQGKTKVLWYGQWYPGPSDLQLNEMCLADAEVDYSSPFEDRRPEAVECVTPKLRFVWAVWKLDCPEARKRWSFELLNTPDAVARLGEVRFSDRTVQFDLPLFDPTLLKWGARLAWLQALNLSEKCPKWFLIRSLRGLGRLKEVADSGSDGDANDALTACEMGAVHFALGERDRAEEAWKNWKSSLEPGTVLRFARTAADLGWDLAFWTHRVQQMLRQSRDAYENRALGEARFDVKYRDWIWLLAWLRLKQALVSRARDVPFPVAMDRALQTLDIAYKRTERHSLSRHTSLHLAQAGYIYSEAGRLDDLLYYPYHETMLPQQFPCEAVRRYASWLQAVRKLENPQFQEKPVVPVSHWSREALLFGEDQKAGTALQAGMPALPEGAGQAGMPALPGEASTGAESRRNPLYLVLVVGGLILVGLAALLFRKRVFGPRNGQGVGQ